MLKQASVINCTCNNPLIFPDGEIKVKCKCGAIWECGEEGFWYCTNPFVPIGVSRSYKSRNERYAHFPKSRKRRR